MQHVIHPAHCPLGDGPLGQIAFEKIDARDVVEVAPLSGDEAVGDAHAVTAADELFGEVRADETGAAGDEIGRVVSSQKSVVRS